MTGIRLEGPFYEYFDPSWYAKGSGLRALGEDVVIDNCEVWGFAYAAIYANGDDHIYHNHVHHNARDGLGYSVVTVGGHPVIEWNYFEYNRHSVASTGDHHGYTVRYNHFGSAAAGVVIDIHRPGGVRSAVHNDIVEAVDDIQGRHDPLQAIHVRGVPDESYDVHQNWFFNPKKPRSSPVGSWTTEVITQPTETAWRNVSFWDNVYGEDVAAKAGDIILVTSSEVSITLRSRVDLTSTLSFPNSRSFSDHQTTPAYDDRRVPPRTVLDKAELRPLARAIRPVTIP